METSSNFPLIAVLVFTVMFASTMIMLEAGRRIGVRQRAVNPVDTVAGLGAIEGAVFGVMGLLIAFTFSGAASRFDVRRQLVLQETNAIGTAYLRLDLLPTGDQPKLREDFQRYVDARISLYRNRDLEAYKSEMSKTTALQGRIWTQAVAGCKEVNSPAVTSLVLSSLNEMIDITTTRAVARQTHPPEIIFIMLFVLLLASSLLAGYSMSAGKGRSWLHMVSFVAIMTLAVYVIIDMEFPRVGLVRVDSVDQILVDLRNSMT